MVSICGPYSGKDCRTTMSIVTRESAASTQVQRNSEKRQSKQVDQQEVEMQDRKRLE
jgi:hypothetical protein